MDKTSRKRRGGLALATTLLCLSSALSNPALALNRWVELVNHTDHSLVKFFASNEDRSDWGHDRLGRHVIDPNHSIQRNIDDGSGYCMYDFKAVFDDGDVLTDFGINVCEIPDFTYF